jgi:2'-hydroxyisoflavone reductase
MNILLIGGSRFVGPYVVQNLTKNGHRITVFNRGNLQEKYPVGVSFVKGDRNEGFGIEKKFDAIIDMCAYRGEQTQKAIKELKFDYFLHFGTVAAYKKTEIFPITEEFPIGSWPSFGDYNKGKVECERVLEKSNIKHAIIRPAYILGPANYCDRENFIYSRIKKTKALVLPGNGLGLAQFVFADEVANIITFLVDKQITGSFNVAGDSVVTLYGLVLEMGKIVGIEPKIEYDANAIGENFKEEIFPFDNENLVVSNEKIKNNGFKFRFLVDGLKNDYEKYYKNRT